MNSAEQAVAIRIVPGARTGEDVDWEAVYAEQLPRVYNFFRYRVGTGPDAEDLTSETFERAWRARDRYRRDKAAFGTWLLTIARRLAVDHYRRRRDYLPIEAALQLAGGATLEEIAQQRFRSDRLARLLDGLPKRERELVALKYGAELTNRAIAKVSGLSESNVGTILHRTVQTLRVQWFADDEKERGNEP